MIVEVPRSTRQMNEWMDLSEYHEYKDSEVRDNLKNLVAHHEIESGWETITGRVRAYTYNRDYIYSYWVEDQDAEGIVRPLQNPTCPSSRTFLWNFQNSFEPHSAADFVSGFFAGGSQRLPYGFLEVQPPRIWRDRLGWTPCPHNPLKWECDGDTVAKFESCLLYTSPSPRD